MYSVPWLLYCTMMHPVIHNSMVPIAYTQSINNQAPLV